MSGKNNAGGAPATGARRESDTFEKLLWSESTEEEYLKQMIGRKHFDTNDHEEKQVETSSLPGAIKAMEDINVDETASLVEYLKEMAGGKMFETNGYEEDQGETSTLPGAIKAMEGLKIDENASLVERRHISSSLERILRFGKRKEPHESDSRSNSAGDDYDLVGRNHDDDDNNTVDEMIEESEREEETNLSNILERISANSDSVSTDLSAAMTSTKTIRLQISKTFQDRQASPGNCNNKKSLVCAMNNSFHSKRSLRNSNDSLAGNETVDKIVSHMMDGDTSAAGGEEERTLHSWTDFRPIAGSVATPLGKNSIDNNIGDVADIANKFVEDDTSVGSISEEIDVIVAKHTKQLVDEVGAIKHMYPGEAVTIGNTMISSLSFDATHFARVRSQLGVMHSTDENEAKMTTSKVERKGDGDVEKGGNAHWWVQAEKMPLTPKRTSSYNTPSPQNSVEKSKEAPDTPSTVISMGRILGLATPDPSDADPNEYEDNKYKNKSYKANISTKTFSRWAPGWGRLAFLNRASAKYGNIFLWLITGAVVMLLISVILVIAAFSKLSESAKVSNEPSPPVSELIDPDENNIIFDLDSITIKSPPSLDWSLDDKENELFDIDPVSVSPDQYIIEDELSQTDPPTVSPDLPTASPDPPTVSPNPPTDSPDPSTASPNLSDNPDFAFLNERLRKILAIRLPESLSQLNDPTSPQFRALEWLRSNPPVIEELKFKPLAQKYVLAVLYFSTNGEEWLDNTGWLSSNEECEWFSTSEKGSICDSKGRVIEIDLRSNNLDGSIPSELVLLSEHMIRIRVNGNSLNGNLPSFVGEMKNLERFHAHWNFFSGTIPTKLGELPRLLSLRLGHNDIVGTIPWQLRDLQNLEALHLGANYLTGTLPFFLGDLSNLTELDLSKNELSGTIPLEFMKFQSMISLELDRNNLTGSMPTEICSRLPFLESAKVDCKEVYCWCCQGCND